MSKEIPLGKREGPRLEFKGAAALKTPEVIARGIVAMLNAEGGEVWVGLREENERAVAVEPIPDPDQERRRLEDHLIDAIEPAPSSKEVEIETQASEEGFVLRVIARPQPGRAPYALLKGAGRQFTIRVGPRSRPMTREELKERFAQVAAISPASEELALLEAKRRLAREKEQAQRSRVRQFWLGLESTVDLDLDLQNPRYEELLREPLLTENRRNGATFVIQYAPGPRLKQDRLILEDERVGNRAVAFHRRGALTFRASLDALRASTEREIEPWVLWEYPISALRIASKVYQEGGLPPNARVFADLSFFGLRGWKLRPGSFFSTWLPSPQPSAFEDSDDLLWEPLDFSAEEIASEPDRCGYRLVERVYEAFGFRREQIPQEFDQKTGHLILPE
jgi:hypothetical protein